MMRLGGSGGESSLDSSSPTNFGPHGHEAPQTPDTGAPTHEGLLVQGQARKEKVWKNLDPPRQLNYTAAAEDQWAKWTSNDAVSALLETESADVEARLKEDGKSDYILSTR